MLAVTASPGCWPPALTSCSSRWPISPPWRRAMASADNDRARLDEAARAGWLYYIAGHTQEEIARILKVSRASAQRLVSLCLAERLITFRLAHPIAACMEIAERLRAAWSLEHCEIVPTDPTAPLSPAGAAERAANLLETTLRSE